VHTIFKGSISFGLVHIPIKLYAATEEKSIKLRFLHNKCHHPIRYQKMCPVCETEVEQAEIVKGYEYDQGRFVTLEQDELDALGQERNRNIEIIDFVHLNDIDPIYFNRSYFVGPNENGEKAFALLRQAMDESGKIGVAKITMRSKQHLAVIRVYRHGLVLETIHYPDEIRDVSHVPALPENMELNQKELNMAIQLIEQLTTEFEPEKYTDEYRTGLQELIQSKITGDEIKIAKEVPKTDIVNLMEALQASIDQTKGEKKQTRAKRGRKKKETG
jgi:DNA end-binding protein Ku